MRWGLLGRGAYRTVSGHVWTDRLETLNVQTQEQILTMACLVVVADCFVLLPAGFPVCAPTPRLLIQSFEPNCQERPVTSPTTPQTPPHRPHCPCHTDHPQERPRQLSLDDAVDVQLLPEAAVPYELPELVEDQILEKLLRRRQKWEVPVSSPASLSLAPFCLGSSCVHHTSGSRAESTGVIKPHPSVGVSAVLGHTFGPPRHLPGLLDRLPS